MQRLLPNDMLDNWDDPTLQHYFLGLANHLEDMARACRERTSAKSDDLVAIGLPENAYDTSLQTELAWLTRALRENGHTRFAAAADAAHTIARRDDLLSRNVREADSKFGLQQTLDLQSANYLDPETLTELIQLHEALAEKYRAALSKKGAE